MRFGNPLDAGYLRDPSPEFGSSILDGVLALLFSPSASIFLYSPFTLLGLAGLLLFFRRDRITAALLFSLVAIFLLLYATLGNWLGGRSYGSRYLVVVLPYLAVGWAVILAKPFAPCPPARLCAGNRHRPRPADARSARRLREGQSVGGRRAGRLYDRQRQWDWRASALFLNGHALLNAVPDNISYVIGNRTPPVIPRAGERRRSRIFATVCFQSRLLVAVPVLPARLAAHGGLRARLNVRRVDYVLCVAVE